MEAAQLQRRTVSLGSGRTALVVEAPPAVAGADAVAALGLDTPRGLIVLNGGTAEASTEAVAKLRRTVSEELAQVAAAEQLTVLTGGTDAGIFAAFGQALGDRQPSACIGVAPRALVSLPDDAADEPGREWVPLEPHHTHFLLVDGDRWGVETDAMMVLGAALARASPSIAVLVGGGDVAKQEVLAHVRARREIVVVAGTGGLADELADASARSGAGDQDIAMVVSSGLLRILDPAAGTQLPELLRGKLGQRRRRRFSKPALVKSLPHPRWRPGPRYPLVPPKDRAAAPALADDLEILDRELLPDFYELDEGAQRAQNTYRLGQVFVILGGAAATALGAVQTALGGGNVVIGIAEALVSGALTGGVAYVRGRQAQHEYFTTRLKAERLRGEYFLFLGRLEPYRAAAREQRMAALRGRVGQIVTEEGP